MKKVLYIVFMVVSLIGLVACNDEPIKDLNELLASIELGYQNGEDASGITSNLTLPVNIEGYEEIEITWITSNPEYVQIEANLAIVYRQKEDVEVTLTVELTDLLDTKYKYFNLIIKALETTGELDTEAPVITGTKNFEVTVGSVAPNYLEGVMATDNIDGNVSVTFDDSQVNLNEVGVYHLIYKAVDQAGNESEFIVDVVVVEADETDVVAPVITGTRDFEYTIGEPTPNYLAGVSATDNVDETVVVLADDSAVDLTVAGNYDLIYSATDLAGNTSFVVVTVYVIDESVVSEGQTVVETFDNLNLSGSSYVGGSFSGVNNIQWTYQGVRGDQDLNGDALTFGGRSTDNSSLKATIDGGIYEISLKHKQPFGSTQAYGVYINNTLVGEFTATETIDTFAYTFDEPIVGAFTLEIKPVSPGSSRAQLTIDDLTWTTAPMNPIPQAQKDAEFDTANLEIPTSFIEDGQIDFITTGQSGSVITWSYVDPASIHNEYVDLTTGHVTVPENGSYKVLVSARITNDIYTNTKAFIITVGEGDAIDIASVLSLSLNDYARTIGVITSIYHNGSESYLFIQDDAAAVLVKAPKSLALNLASGDKVEVKGSKGIQNNFIIIDKVRDIKKVGTGVVLPESITADELNQYGAKLVTISGLIAKTYETNVLNYQFHTLTNSYNLYIPSDLDETIKLSIQNKLLNVEAGTEVTITAPVMRIGASYYLYITNSDELIVADSIYFNDVSDIIKSNLSIPNMASVIETDIPLTKSSELLFGATITWQSSNPEVLSHTGIIYKSSTQVQVNITYTILFDGEVVDTKTFNLTIASLSNYTGYYASLANKSGAALEQALRSLIKNTGRATGSTSQVKTVDNYNGRNYNIYTGFGAYGNREHVWPNSKLGNAPDYDLHNLRAAVVSVNSSRSNYPFTNQVSQASWERIGSSFYPGQEHVGDVARIVLYISVRYNLSLNLVGNLNMFLTWHEEDPVSDFELSRNSKIFTIQSNRNPFIDHPELVDVLFS